MATPSRNLPGSLALALALVAIACSPGPAAAHKMHVFAHAEAGTLHGEVYAGGDPVRDARVDVFDPTGEKLGHATTDEKGTFTFEARFRCDHRLVVDAGSGHGAEFTLPAQELPDALPPRAGQSAAASPPHVETHQHSHAGHSDHSLREQLETLNNQVVQLRRDLGRYQHQMRRKDLLAAIGYILGLAGVAFYFLGLRKRDEGRGEREG